MTTFLWTVVILMAAALVAEIVAFAGMALVASRSARRAAELQEQVMQRLKPLLRTIEELKLYLQPRAESIRRDAAEVSALLAARSRTIEAAYADTSRRTERIRLRLNEGLQTVEEQRRGDVEPIRAAGQVFRGLKLALWLLRRVA